MRSENELRDRDRPFMAEAIRLARRGLTKVEPNPAVGAVIVRSGKILGRGFHKRFGSDHAEIVAIKDARSRGSSIRRATLYVTLEPCCHTGKTPPCTEAIVREHFARVVIAAPDPSEKVAGRGIHVLRRHGIRVDIGLLNDRARQLNAWFYAYHERHRPWVIAKWAQTLDGKLACSTGRSQWISSQAARKRVHTLRRSVQAIVTGIGTVLADDPELTVRLTSPSPAGPAIRAVLDPALRIPLRSKLVATARTTPTVIFAGHNADPEKASKLAKHGCQIHTQRSRRGKLDLSTVIDQLGVQGRPRVLVEAGPRLISKFLIDDLVDELIIFQAPTFALDDRARQFAGRHPTRVADFIDRFRHHKARKAGDDLMLVLRRK